MAGKLKDRLPRHFELWLWVSLAFLVGFGILFTAVDLYRLPTEQARKANATGQRFVINLSTGEISLGGTTSVGAKKEEAPAFDVGEATAKDKASDTTTPIPIVTASGAAADALLPKDAPVLRTEAMDSSLPTIGSSNEALVPAPAPEVSEINGDVALPKRGKDDLTPAKFYARPFKRNPDQVLLAIVVIDAGLDPQTMGLLHMLPPEITVAFSPYTRSESKYATILRSTGHEVWTMLPTMTDRYPQDDPGPLGIIAKMPPEEVTRRLEAVMASIQGSVGFVLPPDETLSQQKGSLRPVLEEVHQRGLLALSTHPSRSIEQLSNDKNVVPHLRRADVIIDPVPNESHIRSKFAGLLTAMKEKSEYVVIVSARVQSLQLLQEWLKQKSFGEPITLAPLSAIYQPKEAPEPPPSEESDDGHGGGHGGEKPKKAEGGHGGGH